MSGCSHYAGIHHSVGSWMLSGIFWGTAGDIPAYCSNIWRNIRMGICCESGNYSSGRIGSGYRFDHFTHTSNYNSFGRHLWPSTLGRLFLMDKVSLFMNHLPVQMISFHGWGVFPLIILFVGISVSQNRYRFRSMLVCLLLGNFFIWTHILESSQFTVTFLDVGRGRLCN